jgi:hypothetical protein
VSAAWKRCAAVVAVGTSALVGVARSARAETSLVVLARPPPGHTGDTEVANRVRGELLADGFSVQWVDATPDGDRVATLTRASHVAGAAVAAGLWVAEDGRAIELVLVDGLTGRSLVRRLEPEPGSAGQAPEVMARRSVDFVRAGLLDFLVESLRSAVSDAHRVPPVVPKAEASDGTEKSRWAIEAGVGVLGSFEGVGPATMPVARVRFAASPTWQLRITTAWLGTQPLLEFPTGTASVAQGIALLECSAHFWRRRIFRPLVSFGAGTYYVGVTGSGAAPDRGERSTAFSFAFDAGVGVAAAMGSHFEVLLEAQAILAEPGIGIRFVGVDSARIGHPSVLGTLTIAGWI